MEKLRMLMGNALAGSLDFGMGALIAAATLSSFGIHPELWHLFIGGIAALLPDFDIVMPILLSKEPTGNHRTSFMHRPLILIPLATLVAYLVGAEAWGLIAFLCVSWHFVHDTPPLSQGGIAWLWPFNSWNWSLWGPEKPQTGGMSHNEWLKKYWLKLTPLSCIEVGAGLMAISFALLIVSRLP